MVLVTKSDVKPLEVTKPKAEYDLESGTGEEKEEDYSRTTVLGIIKARTGWLAFFAGGLVLAAFVVEHFDDIIERHVELSFFVPLIMGQGGNIGSQTVATLIRALALHQVTWKDVMKVVWKESVAGFVMGGALGIGILFLSMLWSSVSSEVGLVVAIAMPVVSLWSNCLAAFLTLASQRLRFDPAMTSGPLMSTIVDSTGLVIYFYIAMFVISDGLHSSEVHRSMPHAKNMP